MSASDALLIFLDTHGEIEGWLQLGGGQVVARGPGLDGLPTPGEAADDRDTLRQVLVAPGDAVTLHWLEVPAGLAPAQAAAAARLAAADVSAQPIGDLHVAVGPEIEDRPIRAVALMPALTMAGWLGRMAANGVDPDLVIAEPLLLPEPDEGFTRYDRGDKPLLRGRSDAFSLEPELVELVIGGAPVAHIDHEAYEAGLAAAIASPAVNLRQGEFAKRRQWRIDWAVVRRLAAVGLAILLVTLAIQFVLILRYTWSADALEVEARQVAGQVVPGAAQATDPAARLRQRLIEAGGGAAGYAALASALFDAVNSIPNVELTALSYDRDGSLRATVHADSAATLTAMQERIRAGGLVADLAQQRAAGGRQAAELTVRAP